MKKKAYISPEAEVVTIKIEQLMGFTVSGELRSDSTPDESADDNRSRRLNVWDDNEVEEEEEW